MQRTVILDNCFLNWLWKFDSFCERQGIPKGQLPLDGLDHLLARGCTLLLPNEVLKEATHSKVGRLGMSMSLDAQPFLDQRFLDPDQPFAKGNPLFIAWLRNKLIQTELVTFANSADYLKAERAGALKGKICLVADRTPEGLGGVERLDIRPKIPMDGDSEILNLAQRMHDSDGTDAPRVVVLSNDGGLKRNLDKLPGHRFNTFDGYSYMEMLALTRFTNDFRRFPKALAMFNTVDDRHILNQPDSETHNILNRTMKEWGIGRFAPGPQAQVSHTQAAAHRDGTGGWAGRRG
ncbi:MAG: hypothetical protein ACKVOE_05405 [Rickettsiales bacterium]